MERVVLGQQAFDSTVVEQDGLEVGKCVGSGGGGGGEIGGTP